MTQREKITLTGEKFTLLVTLYPKAMESRLPDSTLHDHFADAVVQRIDYDFAGLRLNRDAAISLALRAKTLDDWTRDFLRRHPGATVLNLGCGLDSRVFRVDPAPDVRWFDVDYPDVIALRRRLYPARENCTLVGSSVTDPGWVEQVPTDRPAMIVAEGLLVYLAPQEVPALLRRLVERFPSGELAFDGYARFALRLMGRMRVIRRARAVLRWSLDDPAELERAVPGLRFIESSVADDPAQLARFSVPTRVLAHLWARLPAMRRMGRLLRYRF